MSKEKNENQPLNEAADLASNNYMGVGKGPGQSAMVLKPGRITLADIVKQAHDWENEMNKAPNRLPYPLQDGLAEQLGKLYVDAVVIKDKVAQSAENPIIKYNTKAIKEMKSIYKKLSAVADAIKSTSAEIDGLSVGTSTPEDHA